MRATIGFVFILVGFLNQCSDERVGPAPLKAKLGEEVRLEAKRLAIFTVPENGSSSQLTVFFDDPVDSRCPADAVCIWAGYAKLTLRLSSSKGGSQEVTLCLGDCRQDSSSPGSFRLTDEEEVTVGDETYRVLLKEIGPYPVSNSQQAEQEAKFAALVITRK